MGGAKSDDSIEDRAWQVPEVTTVSKIVRGRCPKRRQYQGSRVAGAGSDDSIEDGAWEVPEVTTVSRIVRGRCQR